MAIRPSGCRPNENQTKWVLPKWDQPKWQLDRVAIRPSGFRPNGNQKKGLS